MEAFLVSVWPDSFFHRYYHHHTTYTQASLEKLKNIDLSNTKLDGVIPSELGLLSNLEVLELSHCRLTGGGRGSALPESFSKLTNLKQLYVGHNDITGVLPPKCLVGCKKLVHLDVSHNKIAGKVCRLGQCTDLVTLDCSNNHLTGLQSFAELQQLQVRVYVSDPEPQNTNHYTNH